MSLRDFQRDAVALKRGYLADPATIGAHIVQTMYLLWAKYDGPGQEPPTLDDCRVRYQ